MYISQSAKLKEEFDSKLKLKSTLNTVIEVRVITRLIIGLPANPY